MRIGPSSRIVGIDDGPFAHSPRANVVVVGVLMRGAGRVEGILATRIVKDGFSATDALRRMLGTGRFAGQAQAVLTDGIALGGFNMIHISALSATLGVPVIAVMRKAPDLGAMRAAMNRTTCPNRRWRAVVEAGAIHEAGGLRFQVAGASSTEAAQVLGASMGDGSYPEALRIAHMIAGAIVNGVSRGRP